MRPSPTIQTARMWPMPPCRAVFGDRIATPRETAWHGTRSLVLSLVEQLGRQVLNRFKAGTKILALTVSKGGARLHVRDSELHLLSHCSQRYEDRYLVGWKEINGYERAKAGRLLDKMLQRLQSRGAVRLNHFVRASSGANEQRCEAKSFSSCIRALKRSLPPRKPDCNPESDERANGLHPGRGCRLQKLGEPRPTARSDEGKTGKQEDEGECPDRGSPIWVVILLHLFLRFELSLLGGAYGLCLCLGLAGLENRGCMSPGSDLVRSCLQVLEACFAVPNVIVECLEKLGGTRRVKRAGCRNAKREQAPQLPTVLHQDYEVTQHDGVIEFVEWHGRNVQSESSDVVHFEVDGLVVDFDDGSAIRHLRSQPLCLRQAGVREGDHDRMPALASLDIDLLLAPTLQIVLPKDDACRRRDSKHRKHRLNPGCEAAVGVCPVDDSGPASHQGDEQRAESPRDQHFPTVHFPHPDSLKAAV
ncbi:hypothetical protein Varpa_1977 [Variovorax paradoxus EPS]|uniref:Uncharacterized protein n=1 Tax=Variovorax paradoxus (strain EPS) TaxID=595537 RepID=E6V8W4_VARPE|nr:hypothetical protein Varpa_1977 [Variovorax paradoxus EPS]